MTATVLLVGADPTVGRELSAAGYRVVDARLVDEAVVRAGTTRPDVVVVYVHGGDGAAATTCRRLRSHPLTATARILVVGAGDDVPPAEALTAGADATLPPAAPDVVFAQVQALLHGRDDERLRELLATAELRSAELTAVIESMPDAVYMGTRAGITDCNSDITVQKRAEEALREADRHKDEFIPILSHELRNPLAAIRYALPALQPRAADAAGW